MVKKIISSDHVHTKFDVKSSSIYIANNNNIEQISRIAITKKKNHIHTTRMQLTWIFAIATAAFDSLANNNNRRGVCSLPVFDVGALQNLDPRERQSPNWEWISPLSCTVTQTNTPIINFFFSICSRKCSYGVLCNFSGKIRQGHCFYYVRTY